MPLWLVGMMGSGKTTVGRAVADRTGSEFLDTDQMVESGGWSVAEIFATEGEVGFRARESVAVAQASCHPRAVVATGGGAVLTTENVDLMHASGPVIWLRADPATLADRNRGSNDRPLLVGADTLARLEQLAEAREAAYEAAADHVVVTDRLGVEAVVELVEALWNAS